MIHEYLAGVNCRIQLFSLTPALARSIVYPLKEDYMTNLAERLKFARARAKISQESLSHRVGITKANISKIELGLTENCALATLFGMADILGVDARWLATGKQELAPSGDGPTLRFDANKALAELPHDLKDPLLTLIENAAKASEQRYWTWVKEREG
jgi:transcriptional regulator with XRE-family HTH domain